MHFNAGDTVKLKSGGPVMTISEMLDDEQALCVWFDQDKQRQAETFETCTLVQVNEQ